MGPLGVPVHFPQHADQHRPERPVLLAVDQERCAERTFQQTSAAGGGDHLRCVYNRH